MIMGHDEFAELVHGFVAGAFLLSQDLCLFRGQGAILAIFTGQFEHTILFHLLFQEFSILI